MQANIAGAMRNLSDFDECAIDIATADGLEVLTTALDKTDTAYLNKHASAHHGVGSPFPQVLVDAFARHQSSLEVSRAAADAMWGLSVNDEVSGVAECMLIASLHAGCRGCSLSAC